MRHEKWAFLKWGGLGVRHEMGGFRSGKVIPPPSTLREICVDIIRKVLAQVFPALAQEIWGLAQKKQGLAQEKGALAQTLFQYV